MFVADLSKIVTHFGLFSVLPECQSFFFLHVNWKNMSIC